MDTPNSPSLLKHSNHPRPLSQSLVTVVLPAIAILVAAMAMWLWYNETRVERRDPPDITTQEGTLERANLVLDRAEDSINTSQLILSFLEGASAIITVAVAAAAIVGLSSINELRDGVRETEQELLRRVEEAEARFLAREKQLANMEDLIAKAEVRFDRAIEERLGQVYIETETARRRSASLAQSALAEQLAHRKNIDAALQACEEAYHLDPENYANNYLYGMLLIEKGDYESALKRLEEALMLKPDFAPAIAALGLANRRIGDLAEDRRVRNEHYNVAEARLLEALRRDPALLTNDGESYYGTLGSLYRRQERIADGLDSYRRAAEVTPQRSYPYVNLAMLYMQQDDEQLRDQNLLIAERNARRRLADVATDYWALYDLGLICLIQNDVEGMKQNFKEAIEVSPPAASIYHSVIARLLFLRDFAPDLQGLSVGIEMLNTPLRRISNR